MGAMFPVRFWPVVKMALIGGSLLPPPGGEDFFHHSEEPRICRILTESAKFQKIIHQVASSEP